MKKIKLLTLIFSVMVLLSFINSVQCSTVTSVTLEIYPSKGDITTDIFLHIRGKPYSGNYSVGFEDVPVLYVYYDDKLIVDKMQPFVVPHKFEGYTDYLLSFDVKTKVPDEFPYSELGLHTITIVIEAKDGTHASAYETFEVVNYVPPPDWWKNLSEDFLNEITGPQGEQGTKGEVGKSAYELWLEQDNSGSIDDFLDSIKGEKGESVKGDTGESVYELWLKQGNNGTIRDFLNSLKGEQGIQGIQGEQGIQGKQGDSALGYALFAMKQGDSALGYALFAMVVSIIAILIALISYNKD